MQRLCQQHGLLSSEDGLVRVPFLVKGRLIVPPALGRAEVEAAFTHVDDGAACVRLPQAQLIREPILDRGTGRYSGYQYQVLPPLDPLDLIETDFDRLLNGPYSLPVDAIVDFARTIGAALQQNPAVVARVRQLCGLTMEHPEPYLDGAFAALQSGWEAQAARGLIDNELAVWNIPGSRFLNGWVEVPAEAMPGLVPLLARGLPQGDLASGAPSGPVCLRAMPTRQLHITAGNAPEVPLVSALRLVLSKSAGVIKLPLEATLPGALLALAAAAAAPDHPLTQNLSIVYWPGGDESVEQVLFAPGAFDRIVVWGAPGAVTSVQSRALYTRVVAFNPRYGVSLIGREAAADGYLAAAFLAAMDTLIYSQKACTASLVHYVEGGLQQARAYASQLRARLAQWDDLAPPFSLPAARGQLKRLRRGKYPRAEWLANTRAGEHASAVVILPDEFDILDHPMSRLVVVRPVADLRAALRYLHAGVSTAGVHPETRRLELRDAIAARGVSRVLPLGQADVLFAGAPHDGMMVLNELVDWKIA